jgi:hypothetical protein
MKNLSRGSQLFDADGRTDRRNEAKCRFSQFCEKAPKTVSETGCCDSDSNKNPVILGWQILEYTDPQNGSSNCTRNFCNYSKINTLYCSGRTVHQMFILCNYNVLLTVVGLVCNELLPCVYVCYLMCIVLLCV